MRIELGEFFFTGIYLWRRVEAFENQIEVEKHVNKIDRTEASDNEDCCQ